MAHLQLVVKGDSMKRRKSSTTTRRSNRLQDEVYRKMYLLESRRPGSEMALALALLHAWNEMGSSPQNEDFGRWLQQICPLCVMMIEDSLAKSPAGWPAIQ